MPRATTTSDIFNAIAEPRRRQIVEYLAGEERDVSEIVLKLGLPQPAVSKHLSVLRRVGAVAVEKVGQRRVYRLNAKELKTVHDWTKTFERLWTDHLLSIKEVAERKAKDLAARAVGKTSTLKEKHHDR